MTVNHLAMPAAGYAYANRCFYPPETFALTAAGQYHIFAKIDQMSEAEAMEIEIKIELVKVEFT